MGKSIPLSEAEKEEMFQYWEKHQEAQFSEIAKRFEKKFGKPITVLQMYKIFLKKI